QIREMDVPFVKAPQDWRADVTFMADNVANLLRGCGKIVNVGHGLLSKGQYFTGRDIILRENDSDLLCVPGVYHRDRLLKSGKIRIPVVATGVPKLDPLFSPNCFSRNDLFKQANLDPTRKAVLYAPTFNIELSAIPILWMRIAELVDENTYLIIKLHGSTIREFCEAHMELASRHNNIFFVLQQDITPYLLLADVMVSDVSSAFMEFITLDKPVVLFNNPNRHTYVNYDPSDIEYAWRDEIGLQASTFEETRDAVERSLKWPEEYSPSRRKYADLLLADRSGRASANVIDATEAMLDNRLDRFVAVGQRSMPVRSPDSILINSSMIRPEAPSA
ncbi:MAG: CDP-glycerol glycerophosphotransferase family protein, partial [bacterium]